MKTLIIVHINNIRDVYENIVSCKITNKTIIVNDSFSIELEPDDLIVLK